MTRSRGERKKISTRPHRLLATPQRSGQPDATIDCVRLGHILFIEPNAILVYLNGSLGKEDSYAPIMARDCHAVLGRFACGRAACPPDERSSVTVPTVATYGHSKPARLSADLELSILRAYASVVATRSSILACTAERGSFACACF